MHLVLAEVVASVLGLGFFPPGWQSVSALGREVAAESLQPVQLPYVLDDPSGMQWNVQADGSLGPGNTDVFDAGGRLYLDQSTQYISAATQAQFDPRHSELTLPRVAVAGLMVSRRVAVNFKEGWCRWINLLENREVTTRRASVRINFDLGAANQGQQPINDLKANEPPVGASFFDGNRSIAFLFAGHGGAIRPTLTAPNGGDQIDLVYNVQIPGRQTIALVQFVAIRPTMDAAQAVFAKASKGDFLDDVPRDLRRRVMNFAAPRKTLGDWELLRDDLLDVVELRNGDQYKGALLDSRFSVQTSYGSVELGADRLAGIVATGEFRRSFLLVGVDGQAYCGALDSPAIRLELTSGQTLSIPRSDVLRVGWRKRAGEPDDWKFNGPLLTLRSGDRIRIDMPRAQINVATRMGLARLRPEMIAAIDFEAPDASANQIELIDGSRFNGIVTGDGIEFTSASLGPLHPLRFALGSLARLQLAPAAEGIAPKDPTTQPTLADESEVPRLTLAGGETLIGAPAGRLSLETAFDTIQIDAAEIAAMRRTTEETDEVQLTLADGAVASGRIQSDSINVRLQCGASLNVPMSIFEDYAQPFPQSPPKVLAEVRGLVMELCRSDNLRSDRAAESLKKMGPPIMGALRSIREGQNANAQSRIDAILTVFQSERRPLPAPVAPPPADAGQAANAPAER